MKQVLYRVFMVVGVTMTMLVAVTVLFIGIHTMRRVVYLDRFFSTVSDEYRAIRNDGDVAVPEIADGGGGSMCVSTALDLEGIPFIGDRNAPVTIVEYSDFECPFCARYFSDAYAQIKERYIDAGLVRLYYKDFPLDNIHPLARPAAVIGKCLYDQRGDDAFFTFHDRVFALGGQLVSVDYMQQIAVEEGADSDTLASCLVNPSYSQRVDADLAEGESVGVTGTPSFVINGELVIGALPFSEFERAIEDALAGNGCQQG